MTKERATINIIRFITNITDISTLFTMLSTNPGPNAIQLSMRKPGPNDPDTHRIANMPKVFNPSEKYPPLWKPSTKNAR